jgi:hypothetical protein
MRLTLILLFGVAAGLAALPAQMTTGATNAAPAVTNSAAASPSAGPGFAPSQAPANWATFQGQTGTASAPQAAATPQAAPAVPGWKPGEPFPAEANWKWATTDGKEYDGVVITGIESNTVTITHSLGVAHLDITSLPPEIQQRLGYDAETAAAARHEKDREDAHPFYRLPELADAKAAARQLHWPLAWVCGDLSSLSVSQPSPGTSDDLMQMSVDYLKSRAVVIFLDGNTELVQAPPAALQQFYHLDDGTIPGGHHFYSPKIVFTDPEGRKQLGRVWYTEMKTGRETEIEVVLDAIAADPAALQGAPADQVPAPSPTP